MFDSLEKERGIDGTLERIISLDARVYLYDTADQETGRGKTMVCTDDYC